MSNEEKLVQENIRRFIVDFDKGDMHIIRKGIALEFGEVNGENVNLRLNFCNMTQDDVVTSIISIVSLGKELGVIDDVLYNHKIEKLLNRGVENEELSS